MPEDVYERALNFFEVLADTLGLPDARYLMIGLGIDPDNKEQVIRAYRILSRRDIKKKFIQVIETIRTEMDLHDFLSYFRERVDWGAPETLYDLLEAELAKSMLTEAEAQKLLDMFEKLEKLYRKTRTSRAMLTRYKKELEKYKELVKKYESEIERLKREVERLKRELEARERRPVVARRVVKPTGVIEKVGPQITVETPEGPVVYYQLSALPSFIERERFIRMLSVFGGELADVMIELYKRAEAGPLPIELKNLYFSVETGDFIELVPVYKDSVMVGYRIKPVPTSTAISRIKRALGLVARRRVEREEYGIPYGLAALARYSEILREVSRIHPSVARYFSRIEYLARLCGITKDMDNKTIADKFEACIGWRPPEWIIEEWRKEGYLPG